jgi:hypothetical protein
VGISSWWLPVNDMQPGDTYEDTVRRFCGRYLGFEPAGTVFEPVVPCSLVLAQSARGNVPCHTVVVVVAYAMTDRDFDSLRPGRAVSGALSPQGICRAVRWARPKDIVTDTSLYDPSLRGVMGAFVSHPG